MIEEEVVIWDPDKRHDQAILDLLRRMQWSQHLRYRIRDRGNWLTLPLGGEVWKVVAKFRTALVLTMQEG